MAGRWFAAAAGMPGAASAATMVVILKVKSRERQGLRRLLRRGPRSGKRRPVLLAGGGPGPSVASVLCLSARPAAGVGVWTSRRSVDRRNHTGRAGSSRARHVRAGGRRFSRPDLTPPGRRDLQASPKRREVQTARSPYKRHQGCGGRWRRPGGRRLGRRTRHQGHGVVADGTDPAMVGNNRPKNGRLLPTMRPLPVGPWRRCARGEETGGVWLTAHRTATSRSPTDVSGAPDWQASPKRREVQTAWGAYKKHQG